MPLHVRVALAPVFAAEFVVALVRGRSSEAASGPTDEDGEAFLRQLRVVDGCLREQLAEQNDRNERMLQLTREQLRIFRGGVR